MIFQAIVLLSGFNRLALAHPLGNFTISHYTRLEIAPEQIRIRYIIEMAEISTFQEFEVIDTNHNRAPDKEELEAYGQRMSLLYAQGLHLAIDGVSLPVKVERQQPLWKQDAEGMPNLRVECDFLSDLPASETEAIHQLHFEDRNRRERSGWSEIVVIPKSGISIFDSSAFGTGITDELKSFPPDPLANLNEQEANLSFSRRSAPVGAVILKARDGGKVEATLSSRLIEFITTRNFIVEIGLLGLTIAALFYGYGRRRWDRLKENSPRYDDELLHKP